MITGVEAAGLVLAILPFLLNQLHNYVQGLHTLKSLRTRRYREHLESCAAILGGQQVILISTIGFALDGLVCADELRDLMSSSDGRSWKNSTLDDALRTILGQNYDAFAAMMGEASNILEELSSKLNLDATDPSTVGI